MLLLGLPSPISLSICGACRVTVHFGSCVVLGSVLRAGCSADVVAPAYQSSLVLQGLGAPQPLPQGSSQAACAAVAALCGDGAPFCCLLSVQALPGMASCLASYDVEGAGFALLPWSLDVPGACLALAAPLQQCVGEVVVVRGFGEPPAGSGGGGGGREARGEGGGCSSGPAKCRATSRAVHPTPAWDAAAGALVEACRGHVVPTVFVSGPTGSGKSTLARFLANALLSSQAREPGVAFLDLDLGQPEHTPPGCLSLSLVKAPLLSPPHYRTHHCLPLEALGAGAPPTAAARAAAAPVPWSSASPPSAPPTTTVLAMRYLGSASPRDDPAAFVAAAAALLQVYRRTLACAGVPLVVNSHGWTKGLGYEVLQEFLGVLRPTHTLLLLAERGGGGAAAASASASAAAAASASARSASPREEDARDPPLQPPPYAWQPAPGLSLFSQHGQETLASACLPSALLTLPAWHAEAEGGLGGSGTEIAPAGVGKSVPPRAVRSPPDLRAARLLVYLLSNLRFVDPALVERCIEEEGRR